MGEVLLRFDPGDTRIEQARSFQVWEGGAEYNVARSFASCFAQRALCLTWLVDNPIGHLIETMMRSAGLDLSGIHWQNEDARAGARNGLNFVERGFGLRAPRGVSDRGHTPSRAAEPEDFAWDELLHIKKTRLFHTGGVFAGLSDHTAIVAALAMREAKRSGSLVSFDLNYRDSLWQSRGGRPAANKLSSELLQHADVCFGVMSLEPGAHADRSVIERALVEFKNAHPHLRYIATSLRIVHDHCRHSFGAACLSPDGLHYRAPQPFSIFDRVGGGDGFASGFLFALMEGLGSETALDYGIAHGALVMSTPGDNSMIRRAELEALVARTSQEMVR